MLAVPGWEKLTIGKPFEIPAEYGLILLVYTFHGFVNMFLTIMVVKARNKYGVHYPNLYAPADHKEKEKFDSTQRAHQNFLESWPQLAMMMALVGLYMPLYAAFCGTVWGIGRILYGIGYAKYGPSGRNVGGIMANFFGLFPLLFMLGFIGVRTLQTIDLTSVLTSTGKSEL